MALLSNIFRKCLGVPLRYKPKQYNAHRDLDFSDDSDDGTQTYGTKIDPLAPPPPGMRMDYDPVPTDFFYRLAAIEKPRIAQPSYMSFVRGEQIWHIFNASTITLGRMASRAAQLLQAKHRPYYTHDMIQPEDKGDFIVVVNGKYPLLYGTKGKMKLYRTHSGYPGHLKELNIRQVLEKKEWKKVVNQSIDGMLPKNRIRPKYLDRVHIFPEIYHDFDFLPQFIQKPLPDPNVLLSTEGILKDPNTSLVFSLNPNEIHEDLKGVKYEPMDFEQPFYKKNRNNQYTPKDIRTLKKFNRTMRRFKVFNHRTQKFEIK